MPGLGRPVASALVLLSSVVWAATPTLLLDVQINGHSIGKIGEFTLRNGVLLATPDELHELGIRSPQGLVARHSKGQSVEPDGLIALSDLPGLRWRIDQPSQTIYISAMDESLLPNILEGGDRARTQADAEPEMQSGIGATLNYDTAATMNGRQAGSSSALDLRVFSPAGVVSSGMLAYAGAGNVSTAQASAANRIVRLDNFYTFSDVDSMRRYSVGDVITGGLSWTRPVRLTGVQLRSDFSLRPDLVTFPLPSFGGTAAVPSTVQVLTNGNVVQSNQVDAGPFEIPQLPVVNGASTVSITVTNALGQQVSVTRAFYASASLLAPGLHTFSAQVGPVRREWGQVSNNYGKIAAVGDYSLGLTPNVTFETSIEGTPGTVLAGEGVVLGVGSLGVLNASATASAGSSGGGSRVSFGAQRLGRVLSFGAAEILSSRGFEDVASFNGDAIQRRLLSLTGGFQLRRLGSLGVSYAETRQDPSLHPLVQQAWPGQRGQVLTGSYSLQFSRLSIYVNEFKDFVNAGSNGLRAGVILPLGRRRSVELSAGSGEGYGEARIQKSASEVGDWGYDAYVSGGGSAHAFAQVQHKSPRGLFTGGIDQQGGGTTLRAESQGALSWMDRAVFASNAIYDSFAVVDTNGLADVRVLEENRDVGVTSAKGRLLVPDLRAFQLNHLAINANDVPVDTTLDSEIRNVKPQDRSGIVVRFPIRISHAALLRIVDDAGLPLSVGSKAVLRATQAAFPVGYDGEAYVQDLSALNQVDAELPNGRRCSAAFYYLPIKGVIPTIGPVRCRSSRSPDTDLADKASDFPAAPSSTREASAAPTSPPP